MRSGTPARIGAAALAMALLAGCGSGGGAQTQPPSPAAGASATARTSTAGAAPTPGSGTPGNGTFAIDGSASTASYTAHETFLQQNSPFTPVGKTSAVTGTLVLTGGTFAASTVTVDLRTLKTNDGMRDRHIQQDPLQTATYPNAVFAITGAQGAAPAVSDGQTVSLRLAGKMTLHGTQKAMVWDAKADLEGNTLHLTGTTSFNLPDFGMSPPNIPGFVSVQPGIALAVDLSAKEA